MLTEALFDQRYSKLLQFKMSVFYFNKLLHVNNSCKAKAEFSAAIALQSAVTWFFRSLICWFYQTFERLCIKYFVNVTHLHGNQSFRIGFILCSKNQNLLMSSHSSCGSFLLSVASTCRPTSSKMTGRDSRFIISMDFSCVLALSSSICTSQRFQVMNKFTMSQVTFI